MGCKKSSEEDRKQCQTKSKKKFWEELIAYFPLIRHGPQRKLKKFGGTHADALNQQCALIT
jgi:hypothetical protein